MRRCRWQVTVVTIIIACPFAGCALPAAQDIASDDALADFAVTDVNAASARYLEPVSPRDYLGQVSAWYFGHST